jgi:hypothetical protein
MMFIYVTAVYVSSDPGTYIVHIRFTFQNRVWHPLFKSLLTLSYIRLKVSFNAQFLPLCHKSPKKDIKNIKDRNYD